MARRFVLICLCLALLPLQPASAVKLDSSTVDLQEARLSPGYKRLLATAFQRLQTWCVVNGETSPDELSNNAIAMANMLTRHLQYLFENQFGVSAGRQAILCVQLRHRHLRTSLSKAWDSIKSWEQLAPISMRVPVPWLVLEAMFVASLLRGFSAGGALGRDYISFAIGLLIGFDALLRPGELAILTPSKIALPDSRLHGRVASGLLTITNGKNRRVFGRIQMAAIHDTRALRWLSWLIREMPDDARLLPGGTPKFRKIFADVVKDIGVAGLGLTPASLRAGGATHKFSTGSLDLGQLKFRGRWAVLSTLEHYVQECTATLVMLRLGNDTLTRLEKLAQFGERFEFPPAFPWQQFFSRAKQRVVPRSSHGPSTVGRGDPAR